MLYPHTHFTVRMELASERACGSAGRLKAVACAALHVQRGRAFIRTIRWSVVHFDRY